MSRTTLMLALLLAACGSAEVERAAPTKGATSSQAAQLAAMTPPRIPAAYAAQVVAQAGPACRTFLQCCEETAARMPGVAVDCARVAAYGERTCEQALSNYTKLPADLTSRMPASCTHGVQP
jgi:hypothetical protein